MTVRDTENIAKQKTDDKRMKFLDNSDDINRWAKEISERLATKVTVRQQEEGKGKLYIPFTSTKQLTCLMKVLSKYDP